MPASTAVKYSQSTVAFIPQAKPAKKFAKRFLGCRSPRYIANQLGEPVRALVSVIDDTGYDSLTALREGKSLKPFKERLRVVHAQLHNYPFWISVPIREILGHWFRTIRRASLAVVLALDEGGETDRLVADLYPEQSSGHVVCLGTP